MNTKKKRAAAPAEPLPDGAEKPQKKQPKVVLLKQFLVSEAFAPGEKPRRRKAAFVLHTCAVNARKEFEARCGVKSGECHVSAESALTKEDLSSRDFWKEGANWEIEIPVPSETASQKRYFEAVSRAERVQEARRKAGIRDWDSATEAQLLKVSEILKEEEKKA